MPVYPQNKDVWSRAQSIHGYDIGELRSVLQKSIRRGLVEEAILAAYELHSTGAEVEELLWRRLEIIAVEDVGDGRPDASMLVETLNVQRQRWPDNGERWMFAARAVHALATAPKDRTAMELACWAELVVERGERKVEVLDYHIDVHTRRGTEMNRDAADWWQDGARLDQQIDGRNSRWGDYLDRAMREKFEGRTKSGV